MKSALVSVLIFLLWATGAFILRCHNVRDVLVEGRIYFVDSDCYSRMTRVRMVEAHPGLIIRHQDFENYPRGVDTHATAPMDYTILATKWIVVALLRILDPHGTSILETQMLDVAGALVSPFLGAATCGFLALFARGLSIGIGYRWTVPLCFAISPITIWGTILGRPDHQSLQMALLAVALAAECRLASGQTRRWAVVSGVSWGLAIWVSLYEPAVLFGLVMVSWLWMKPRALVARARHAGWIAFAVVLGFAMLLEGWPATLPDPKMHGYLTNWGKTIGELHHLNPLGPALYGWLGAACLAAPLLLAMAYRADRRALPGLILLLVTFGLTCWQLRWGYFMGLVFALTLPWQIAALRQWWQKALAVVAAMLPVAAAFPEGIHGSGQVWMLLGLALAMWVSFWPRFAQGRSPVLVSALRWQIFAAALAVSAWIIGQFNVVQFWKIYFWLLLLAAIPPWVPAMKNPAAARLAVVGAFLCFALWPALQQWNADLFPDAEKRAQLNYENRLLRETGEALRGPEKAPFMAPWWISPALAYWSGQPGVAGSSHESIAGIVDSARFYLAATPEEAGAILRERDVARVIADTDPARLIHAYAPILGIAEPAQCMAQSLAVPFHRPAPYVVETSANDFFKILAVDRARLNP